MNIFKELKEIECCNCGVLFWVTQELDKNWHETKKSFYCPNGHAQSYRKTTEQILREQLAERDNEIARLEREFKKKSKKNRRS